MKKHILITLLVLGLAAPAAADYEIQAPSFHSRRMMKRNKERRRMQDRTDTTVRDMENGFLGRGFNKAIKGMLRKAERKVKRRDRAEFRALQDEFDRMSLYLDRINFFDPEDLDLLELGDWPYRWEWLNNLYIKLERMIGERGIKAMNLDDMWKLNHAVYVVFQPKDGRWDEKEYLKHFRPFMGIIGYWSALGACNVFNVVFLEKLICMPISFACKTAMDLIGHPLGVTVFRTANKVKGPYPDNDMIDPRELGEEEIKLEYYY
jgi:hypothetical protein